MDHYVNICTNSRRGSKCFATKDPFFNDEVVIEKTEERIIFTHPGMDYVGRTSTCTKQNSGWFTFAFSMEIKNGKYFFDEDESTEDVRVIYLADQHQ